MYLKKKITHTPVDSNNGMLFLELNNYSSIVSLLRLWLPVNCGRISQIFQVTFFSWNSCAFHYKPINIWSTFPDVNYENVTQTLRCSQALKVNNETACFCRVDLKEYLFIWRNKTGKKITLKNLLSAVILNNVEHFEFVLAQFSWTSLKPLDHKYGLYQIMEYHVKV